MNVSAVNGANWLPTEREKVKADNGNGFAEALATAKAKETAAGSVPTVCTPSYTISDEDAEYFREKYGEEYDEEKPYQLFYELVEKKSYRVMTQLVQVEFLAYFRKLCGNKALGKRVIPIIVALVAITTALWEAMIRK